MLDAQARLALHLIARRSLGRARLGEELGLAQGRARSLLARLSAEGLVRPTAGGHELSDAGRRALGPVEGPVLVSARGIAAPGHTALAVVRGARPLLRGSMELHRAAVEAGGTGASVFVAEPGSGVAMPEGIPFNRRTLRAALRGRRVGHDDVVLVGAGATRASARLAAVAAGLRLLEGDAPTKCSIAPSAGA